ncbi:hypothetical protein ACU4GD_11980 [Cupriavidus basilensis]
MAAARKAMTKYQWLFGNRNAKFREISRYVLDSAGMPPWEFQQHEYSEISYSSMGIFRYAPDQTTHSPGNAYRIASSQPTLFSQIGEQSANGGADTSDQPPWATAGVAPPRFLPQLTAKWL